MAKKTFMERIQDLPTDKQIKAIRSKLLLIPKNPNKTDVQAERLTQRLSELLGRPLVNSRHNAATTD